jgi:toxin secretion/phage lysis holin
MEKYFNTLTMAFGLVGGIAVSYLGGMDNILHAILFLVVVDYMTGLAKGIATKSLSSKTGWLGLIKKIMIFVVIAVAVEAEKMFNDSIPLREVVIMFYIANEGISLLENISTFIPLPDKLKDYFLQLRDGGNNNE